MKELSSPLAGEMSGHFFFKHRWFGFDDACFSAAMLLEILTKQAPYETLAARIEKYPKAVNTPEINIPLADEKKFDFIEALKKSNYFSKEKMITVDGLRIEFADGWGLVRASNTTPNLVLRFEASSEQTMHKIQADFKLMMQAIEPTLVVPF